MPEALRANETVRLVRTELESHGICENYDAIPNFTECQGTCDSYTVYNKCKYVLLKWKLLWRNSLTQGVTKVVKMCTAKLEHLLTADRTPSRNRHPWMLRH